MWLTAYWIAPQGLLCLLFHSIQNRLPRGGLTHTKLGLSTSVTKKTSYRFASSPILWRHFLIEIPLSWMTPTGIHIGKTKRQTQPASTTDPLSARHINTLSMAHTLSTWHANTSKLQPSHSHLHTRCHVYIGIMI